jgi:CHAT domain-containing protein
VSDAQSPERSYLALRAGGDRLEASEIEGLPLQNLQLVVLSACSSLGGLGGSSGFTGLSGAFLGAGAHGVIGSLWPVGDETAAPLMTRFHQHYLAHHDPVRALQQAQIEMLRDPDPVKHRPSAWAAFEYVGQ